jgi:TolB-like protein/Tfp pilus assembly protein PilF
MPDTPFAPGNKTAPPPTIEARLESWGEIASYLRRDIRTVQRWERLHGLPIRRLIIGKHGQVYAYRSELDQWVRERQPKADREEPDEEPPPYRWRYRNLGIVAFLAGITLLVAALGYFFWPPTTTEKTRLFVRPLANRSDDAKQQEFVDGLTDEMITQLGRVDPSRLGVFAPTTSKELGGKSIAELRNSLDANYVMEGSVRRAGDQLRIDVQLVSARDQTPIWTNSYTGDVRQVLKFQDEVAADVAREIRLTLPHGSTSFWKRSTSSATRSSLETVEPAVYDAFLKGRTLFLDRDLLRSKAAYEQALTGDPHYAPARAGLAMSVLLLGQSPNDFLRPSEAVTQAREAAQQALKDDPKNADAYCVLANIAQSFDYNWAEAERQYKLAITLDPTNVTAHEWYGYYLMVINRLPEAMAEMNRALEIDPASPLLQNVRGEVYYYQRNFEAAIQQESQALSQSPSFLYARIWLASAYREKKMYKEALAEFDMTRRASNNSPALLSLYAHALAVSGDKTEARQVLVQLESISRQRFVPALYFAAIYTGLGEEDQAFHWLELAQTERYDRLVYLNVDPLADPLRADPRFAALMNRLGLP